MPRKDDSGLGRALQKSKKAQRSSAKAHWENPTKKKEENLKSIIEANSLDSFLEMAEASERDFTTKKGLTIIDPTLVHTSEEETVRSLSNAQPMRIPHRPKWDKTMTADDLDKIERESFLNWRRELAKVEESSLNSFVTPYEKNLDVWRQLWRVVERSDVVAQIVDGRNPMMFRCPDLEDYVKEGDDTKQCLLIINKADYLSEDLRKQWASYYINHNISCVFYSAHLEQEKLNSDTSEDTTLTIDPLSPTIDYGTSTDITLRSTILDRLQLLTYFSQYPKKSTATKCTIGLVGYPNVGKSSVINTMLGVRKGKHSKRVAVGPTPGKTKHFQTMDLTDTLMLCDCPGLVFPSFVKTKSEMLLNGILPISQLRDYHPPLSILTRLITREQFRSTYSLKLPVLLDDPSEEYVSVDQLMTEYCTLKGFMAQTHSGVDMQKGARVMLADFVIGRLLHCSTPPEE